MDCDSGERVTQKKVAAAAPQVDQGSPYRTARCEHLPHNEAEPSIVNLEADNLRREGQELFVEDPLRVEIAQQPRPALDENQLAGIHAAYLVDDRACAHGANAAHRANFDRIGSVMFAQ